MHKNLIIIKKHSLLAIMLLLFSPAFSQQAKMLTPLQMREDVDSLVKYLEETHINPYYRYSKDKFYQNVTSVKSKLNTNLDLIDFYLRVQPLLSKLDDGHTDLPIPEEIYQKRNPFELPYTFKLNVAKPFIVCQNIKSGYLSEIPANSEIISINGIPAKKIVKDIINLNTGETPAFRAEYGERNFSFYLETLYKANGNYNIRYKQGSEIKSANVKGVSQSELMAKSNSSNEILPQNIKDVKSNFTLKLRKNIAIIDFREFDWNGFKEFADSTFKIIKDTHIDNLIINLIDNGGGDSDVGDAFLQYILDEPYKQYDKVLVKFSHLYKERMRKNLGSRKPTQEELKELNKKNGTIETFNLDNNSVENNPLRYNGKVYLLINSQTYSSAADFAQCFKFYKRGLIIGEESGGLIKSFGDIITTHLPNSDLRLTISSTLYYNVGATENDFIGVIPDIIASKDKALQKALEIIEEKQ